MIMDRRYKIYESLMNKAKETREKNKWEFDLEMKNGDEISVYLEGYPITREHKQMDYQLLDDNDTVHKFQTISDIAKWIESKY